MGPSGSGKTSLLNVLAARLALVKNSYYDGLIRCNNQKISGADFSKVGAFVQQDDILNEVMSCREHLTFSARVRAKEGTTEKDI